MDISEDILYFVNKYGNTCVYIYLNGPPEHLVLFCPSPAGKFGVKVSGLHLAPAP
jgi:hypothetical protein